MPSAIDEAAELDFIIKLVYERSRIRLHEGKEELIRARLGKRMRHHGFDSLSAYCQFLRQAANEDEITQLIDALTTNFTSFLRERDHFDFMVQTALPSLLPKDPRPFSIWSAACSTGEEPYTLAFFLSEHYPRIAGWNWRVLATDISTKVLGTARQGIYPLDRLNAVPREWWKKYFQKGAGQWEGHCRVKPSVAETIAFRQINLLGDYSFPEPFEMIFCRNVMIYFDRHTQEQLVRRLNRFLVPQGYLCIGHSESLNGLDIGMRCLRPSIYQKI